MKGQNGITLVSLIITVIVLLILAVVSIAAVNDTDVLTYTDNAIGAHQNGAAAEENTLGDISTLLGNHEAVYKNTIDDDPNT